MKEILKKYNQLHLIFKEIRSYYRKKQTFLTELIETKTDKEELTTKEIEKTNTCKSDTPLNKLIKTLNEIDVDSNSIDIETIKKQIIEEYHFCLINLTNNDLENEKIQIEKTQEELESILNKKTKEISEKYFELEYHDFINLIILFLKDLYPNEDFNYFYKNDKDEKCIYLTINEKEIKVAPISENNTINIRKLLILLYSEDKERKRPIIKLIKESNNLEKLIEDYCLTKPKDITKFLTEFYIKNLQSIGIHEENFIKKD